MDGDRFDALTRALGSGQSRRRILKTLAGGALSAAGFRRLGTAEAKNGGVDNTACVNFCNAAFQKSRDRYECQQAALHGSGPCAACGANIANFCQGTCTNLSTDPTNCGACGQVCAAVDACTPPQCSGGVCNHTPSCSGVQTCGGGGTPGVCGCTPATTCPTGQHCDTISDGCGGALSCGTCTAPANAAATCTNGTCGFLCNAGFTSCGGVCCPTGESCCNGACCAARQFCSNASCTACAELRTPCDPNASLCCQDEPTYCYPNGVVEKVGQECCRPVGGHCDPTRDNDHKSDCCANVEYFNGSYFFGNCGLGGVCGAYGAACGFDSDCVSGQCRGHCNNISPVRVCATDGDCGSSGFCIDIHCT